MRFSVRNVVREDAFQTDQGENLRYARRGIGDGEAVTRVVGVGIECEQSGNAGGVNPADGAQVESDVLVLKQGGDARDERLLLAADLCGQVSRDAGGWFALG